VPFGPGGLGPGRASPIFEPLIELITSTIKPQTWGRKWGGPGLDPVVHQQLEAWSSARPKTSTRPSPTCSSSCARNQDLQVTIEVRFITLQRQLLRADRRRLSSFNIVNDWRPISTRTSNSAGACCARVGWFAKPWPANAPAGNAPSYAPNFEIPFPPRNSFKPGDAAVRPTGSTWPASASPF